MRSNHLHCTGNIKGIKYYQQTNTFLCVLSEARKKIHLNNNHGWGNANESNKTMPTILPILNVVNWIPGTPKHRYSENLCYIYYFAKQKNRKQQSFVLFWLLSLDYDLDTNT